MRATRFLHKILRLKALTQSSDIIYDALTFLVAKHRSHIFKEFPQPTFVANLVRGANIVDNGQQVTFLL